MLETKASFSSVRSSMFACLWSMLFILIRRRKQHTMWSRTLVEGHWYSSGIIWARLQRSLFEHNWNPISISCAECPLQDTLETGKRASHDSLYLNQYGDYLMKAPFNAGQHLNQAVIRLYQNLPAAKEYSYRRWSSSVLSNHEYVFTHWDL